MGLALPNADEARSHRASVTIAPDPTVAHRQTVPRAERTAARMGGRALPTEPCSHTAGHVWEAG